LTFGAGEIIATAIVAADGPNGASHAPCIQFSSFVAFVVNSLNYACGVNALPCGNQLYVDRTIFQGPVEQC
jgi:hypothetical protein